MLGGGAAAGPSNDEGGVPAGVYEFSVTIGETGRDVPPEFEKKLQDFVDHNCNRAYCGLERGATEENLHWQCVMSTKLGMHQRSLHSLIKKAFWGPDKAPRHAHVRIVALTHKGELHTFGGMVGYCAKDMEEAYFKCVAKGVSLELLERGRDIHLAFGAGGACFEPPSKLSHALFDFAF